jgi:nicotinamidase/pyrazinamidase
MPKKALMVIDMLKDFIEETGALYCGERARAIVPFIEKTVRTMRENGAVIIFVADSHEEDDLEFERFTKHCVRGTEGAEIINSLRVEPHDHVVRKRRFSAFYGTDMEQILKNEGIDEVYIVGVCTSICVMDTVRDLKDRDYEVYVLKEGIADFDQEAHDCALKRMQNVLGADLI